MESLSTIVSSIDRRYVSQGFANGLGLFAITPLVTSALRRRRVQGSKWRTAVAAGAFIGGFRLFRQILEGMAKALEQQEQGGAAGSVGIGNSTSNGNKGNAKLRRRVVTLLRLYGNFLAGGLSTALGLAVDDKFLGSFLVSWWALRAVRCLLPALEYGSTVVMCMAAAVINPAAFLFKGEVQPQYAKFMERMALGINRTTLIHDPVQAVIHKKSIHGWDRWVFCDEMHRDFGAHPTSSCTHAILTFAAPKIFLISLRVYAPLYLAWSVVRRKLPNWHLVENSLRSATFLTLYTLTQYFTVIWYTATIKPTCGRLEHAAMAWLAGLWTLVERKERRTELATYCAAHAVNSLWLTYRKGGHFTERSDRLKVSYPLLVLSSAVLTHCQTQHSPFIRSIFGFDGPLNSV